MVRKRTRTAGRRQGFSGHVFARGVLLLIEILATLGLLAAGVYLWRVQQTHADELRWARQLQAAVTAQATPVEAVPGPAGRVVASAPPADRPEPVPARNLGSASAGGLLMQAFGSAIAADRHLLLAILVLLLAFHGIAWSAKSSRRPDVAREHGGRWRMAAGWLKALEIFAVLFLLVAAATTWITLEVMNTTYSELQQSDLGAMVQMAQPSPHPGAEQTAPARLPPLDRPSGAPLPTPQAIATPLFQEMAWMEGEKSMSASPAPAAGAQRIQIPAIGVDNYIFPSSDARALKLGVAQFGPLVAPGEEGNLVLAAHNDSYGKIFRDLGALRPGDEIALSDGDRTFTYRVRERLIVDPDEIWVMLPTAKPTLTLITCTPYLINTERLVVFAGLDQ